MFAAVWTEDEKTKKATTATGRINWTADAVIAAVNSVTEAVVQERVKVMKMFQKEPAERDWTEFKMDKYTLEGKFAFCYVRSRYFTLSMCPPCRCA